MGLFVGGHILYGFYRYFNQQAKLDQKKQYIREEKERLAKTERESYEKKIQEISAERDEYKRLYLSSQEEIREYNRLGRGNSAAPIVREDGEKNGI